MFIRLAEKTGGRITPRGRFATRIHLRARTFTRTLIKTSTLSICFLYFPWRIVSQKSTFKGKICFKITRIHREIRERIRVHPLTGNIRIGACANVHCFARKLRIAQLRIRTISGHVILVSAQQRDNEKGVRCM